MLARAAKRLSDPEFVVGLVADWCDDGDLDEPEHIELVEALSGVARTEL